MAKLILIAMLLLLICLGIVFLNRVIVAQRKFVKERTRRVPTKSKNSFRLVRWRWSGMIEEGFALKKILLQLDPSNKLTSSYIYHPHELKNLSSFSPGVYLHYIHSKDE